MPVNVPGTNTFPANVSVPVDGDPPTGAVLGQPSRDLADRTIWLRNQVQAVAGDGTSTATGSATWSTVSVPTDGGVNTSLSTNALIPLVNRTTYLRNNTLGDASFSYVGTSGFAANIPTWTLGGSPTTLSVPLRSLADRTQYLLSRVGNTSSNYAGSSASFAANVAVPMVGAADTVTIGPALKTLADRTAYLKALIDALNLVATKPQVNEYTTAGTYTWTKPAKADPNGWTEIICVGGGEAGENSNVSIPVAGAGGRAGKVVRARYKTSSLPSALHIVVGRRGERVLTPPDIAPTPSTVRETNSSGAIIVFAAAPGAASVIQPGDVGDFTLGGAAGAPSGLPLAGGYGRPSSYGQGGANGNSGSTVNNGGDGGLGYGAGGGGAGGSPTVVGGGGGGGYGSVALAAKGNGSSSAFNLGGAGAQGYVQISCDVIAI